ncbi:phosphotransferase enzyme family protein [Cytobacillus sp. IB215665]|uniref:phosphotransferase enzyme family protein n=1 Tax=Cytobacillus sp. IB215665 TaxID=3097357 RepID=UPI002A170D54|nr:phosphotransferase [Cytobacillus sp. IB215665]MDX8365715.1 phosphotransferase [Cytobacillus sp. IB215665]
MMKVKYLFINVDLAEMLVQNWENDIGSIAALRISTNAIYTFKYKGETRFLRFSPKTEKCRENILAELEFITYLRSKRYDALEVVNAQNGVDLIEAQTPWGVYYASVFKRVAGVPINKTDFSDHVLFSYGKALGKLHQLACDYKPVRNTRWSYSDVLHWIDHTLSHFPNETAAKVETSMLKQYFKTIPVTKHDFGLVHYDFEYDNVFYDEASHSCHIIDFDDAMYHWYVMDIVQALDSIKECMSDDNYQVMKKQFLAGYLTENEISEDMMSIIPACKRFANLYGYVRVLRSVDEQWNHEPQWLIKLRKNLSKSIKINSLNFGTEIKQEGSFGIVDQSTTL